MKKKGIASLLCMIIIASGCSNTGDHGGVLTGDGTGTDGAPTELIWWTYAPDGLSLIHI